MANTLKMGQKEAIKQLSKHGWSNREIGRRLGIHRETVGKYVKEDGLANSKPAISTAGSELKPAISTTGSDHEKGSKPAKVSTGNSSGRQSKCKPYHDIVEAKLEKGLSAQRIHQDLQIEQGFTGAYECVKRYVKKIEQSVALPFRRMECLPGEEAQIDFGQGAWISLPNGKRKRPHCLRVVLSHSRKAYSEVVYKQDTESFIRCIENAFWHFGGVPKTLVIDNLKAGVIKADWYDPELNPKLLKFATHYGTVVLPSKAYTPRHKGKVEGGVKYVQDNALKGRKFESLTQENDFLLDWEENIADKRIHGTTKKQVGKYFEEHEKKALLPLQAIRFPFFHEGKRKVHRDCHVEVDKSYYSVPAEYMRREVWVRWDSRTVKVLNDRFKQIAIHAKRDIGQFSTDQNHIPPEKICAMEKGTDHSLRRAQLIGPYSYHWSKQLLKARGIEGIRVLQGFLGLTKNYTSKELEKGCKLALSHQAFKLRAIKALIKKPNKQEQFEFMKNHELIRDIEDYEKLFPDMKTAWEHPAPTPPVGEGAGSGN